MEDEAARYFLRQILELYNPRLSRRIEISARNGEGNITALLSKIGAQFERIKVIGVYDGDRRDQLPAGVAFASTVLPGDKGVEGIFRELVKADAVSFQNHTGNGDISAILYSLEGAEDHDWFTRLCVQLGATKEQLFPTLFRMWMARPESKAEGDALIKSILELIGLAE